MLHKLVLNLTMQQLLFDPRWNIFYKQQVPVDFRSLQCLRKALFWTFKS